MVFPDTRRLRIRPLVPEDFSAFAAYVSDGELCRLYGLPVEKDIETIRQIFAAFCQDGKGYAIVRRTTDEMLGHVLVVPPELPSLPPGPGVTLAFAVAPGHQRQGLMTEALQTVMSTLWEQGVEYVHCGCFDFNSASAHLQEKLGFRICGTHALRSGQAVIDRMLTAPNTNDEV